MKALMMCVLLVCAAAGASADEEAARAGQEAIRDLGTLNGQALACRQFTAAANAKMLMIRRAPKTRGFGALFEQATNTAFIEQTKGSVPCPGADDLNARLKEIETRLQTSLPATPPESGS